MSRIFLLTPREKYEILNTIMMNNIKDIFATRHATTSNNFGGGNAYCVGSVESHAIIMPKQERDSRGLGIS